MEQEVGVGNEGLVDFEFEAGVGMGRQIGAQEARVAIVDAEIGIVVADAPARGMAPQCVGPCIGPMDFEGARRIVEKADFGGANAAVEFRREAVDGEVENGSGKAFDGAADVVAERVVELGKDGFLVGRGKLAGEFAPELRTLRGTIEFDKEARGCSEKTGGGSGGGQGPGQIGGAGIPAAVGAEGGLRGGRVEQARPAGGHGICGVLARDDQGGRRGWPGGARGGVHADES